MNKKDNYKQSIIEKNRKGKKINLNNTINNQEQKTQIKQIDKTK